MNQHILVVDDEAAIRDLLAEYFRALDYHVTTASNAGEALRLADETALNLVILDLRLADGNGLAVLDKIRTAHPNLPVIMLTGMGFEDALMQEALRKKATSYASKTLPLSQLLIKVRRVLDQPPA